MARLLIGIFATTPNIKVRLKGDHSLNKRSMKKLVDLMSKFGTSFTPRNKFNFPLKMISSEIPIGIKYYSGVSAQLKSAVILAGLNSFGNTVIVEEKKSRDHTENMLAANNKVIKIKNIKNKIISIAGKKNLKPLNINVPGIPLLQPSLQLLLYSKRIRLLKLKMSV